MIKKLSSLVLGVLINTALLGQPEFQVHENNLIYDALTMQRLRATADSLNIRFRTCDLSQPYYSLPQGTADYFLFDRDIDAVERAIAQKLSPGELLKKFPAAQIIRSVNVVRTSHRYRNQREVRYAAFPESYDDGILDVEMPYSRDNIKTGGWVSKGNSTYLWAFYLHDLKVKEIPYRYARLIQYVDCMVDTTSTVALRPTIKAPKVERSDGSKKERFIRWANDYPGKPIHVELTFPDDPTEEDFELQLQVAERYNRDYRIWDARRLANLDVRMRNSRYWPAILREIANEAIVSGDSDDELEYYIERYVSPEVALYLKRARRVVATCSADQRPRIHTMNIGRLAGRTGKWNVFLRSHLDLMNDDFERDSDGSWAFEGRGTYLKELDTLNIHATDLLLGTVLRTSSVTDNHYQSNPGRIGRALAETSAPDRVENQILAMINDKALDLYNRTLLKSVIQMYRQYRVGQ